MKPKEVKTKEENIFTILIIDDDRMMLKFYEHALQGENIHVELAENGDEGIERARAINPDLILLDVMMPGKSGFEVLKELQGNIDLKKIPVIIFSVLSQPSDMEEALRLGAIKYISKENNSTKEITEEIKKLVKTR